MGDHVGDREPGLPTSVGELATAMSSLSVMGEMGEAFGSALPSEGQLGEAFGSPLYLGELLRSHSV